MAIEITKHFRKRFIQRIANTKRINEITEQAIENGTCTSEIKSTILRKELTDKEKQSYATAKLYKNNVFWFSENKAITVYPLSQKYHGKV
ncbi:hypothetical protein IJG89_00690 [Candidatus Saccharibacteria bacterium]|nr:hypothetical protein [Candidatus Saccharibacteria bacterium]